VITDKLLSETPSLRFTNSGLRLGARMTSLDDDKTGPARIALCITDLAPGGAERMLVELATRLDRRRFEPVVYCLAARPAGNPTSLADRLEAAGIAVHCFGARRAMGFPRLVARLRKRMRDDAPRIVQTFLFHANVAGATAARLAGMRQVVAGIRVAERRAGWHLFVSRRVDRWIARYVCVSESVRQFSIRSGRLPPNKLVVIPNGVDVTRFAGALPCPLSKLGIAAGRRLITFIGRVDVQKGLGELLAQSQPMFEALPQHDLLVVGDGPLRKTLEDHVRNMGLAARIHFVGYRDDVPEILAASDLVVVPSLWEGMSNVVLEAMAAARPIVATRVEGVVEQLGPGAEAQTVTLFDRDVDDRLMTNYVRMIPDPRDCIDNMPALPETNFAGFVQTVMAILGDPSVACSLGEANHKRAAEHFSLSAMVGAYERLYLGLLSRGE
jgi:starch synthase (maltosyl-transferring)